MEKSINTVNNDISASPAMSEASLTAVSLVS